MENLIPNILPMKPIKNNKIRESVNTIINEIPIGMRRYALTKHNKYGSIFGNHYTDYKTLISEIKKDGNDIILWRVKTITTKQTFAIEYALK